MNEEITIKKETIWKIGTFLFAGLFLLTLFFNPTGDNPSPNTGTNQIAPPTAANPPTSAIQVKIDASDPILGDRDAEISIVEFSDFQCPFCQRAFTGALADMKNSEYFKNGEVNLVYKHFPLNSIHPFAQKAAEASECANRQGKFWEFHDQLFLNQQALDVNSLKTYASQIGLDNNKFNTCLDRDEAAGKVASDLKQATDAQGRGTPYFILVNKDGKTVAISGAQPWQSFESAIQSLK